MTRADFTDLFAASRRGEPRPKSSALAEMALDKCAETYQRRDWARFGYWHAVFVRERNRLGGMRSSRGVGEAAAPSQLAG